MPLVPSTDRPPFDPQVRVKSALSGLFAALDADDHREAAAVTGGLGFF